MAHSLGSQALCRMPNPAMPVPDMVNRSATPLRSAATCLDTDPGTLDLFERSLLSADPDVAREAVQALSSTGLSEVQIADLYVPAMARRLGQRWHDDELSFAQVTIGVSRLQRLVRDLVAEPATGQEVGSLLLVVPEAEQHTHWRHPAVWTVAAAGAVGASLPGIPAVRCRGCPVIRILRRRPDLRLEGIQS